MYFSDLFAPLLQSILFKPVQMAGIWAARQTLGKANGDAAAPVVDALAQSAAGSLAGIAAGSLAGIAAARLESDKLARQIGIPTTEQALVGAAQAVLRGTSTLDLSHQSQLTDFLQQSIVRATSAR